MSDTRAPMERLIRANADEINRLRQAIRVAAGVARKRCSGMRQPALNSITAMNGSRSRVATPTR